MKVRISHQVEEDMSVTVMGTSYEMPTFDIPTQWGNIQVNPHSGKKFALYGDVTINGIAYRLSNTFELTDGYWNHTYAYNRKIDARYGMDHMTDAASNVLNDDLKVIAVAFLQTYGFARLNAIEAYNKSVAQQIWALARKDVLEDELAELENNAIPNANKELDKCYLNLLSQMR